MEPQVRLEQVKAELEKLRQDITVPDRDRLMRKLRKERRTLESSLGLREPGDRAPRASSSERKSRKSKRSREPQLSPEERKRKIRRDRKRRQRDLDSNSIDGTVALAESIYIENIPQIVIDGLTEMGIINMMDADQHWKNQQGVLFCFSIRKVDEKKLPQYLVDKFHERWGEFPKFFTKLQQGKFEMVAFGPTGEDLL